MLFVTLVHYPVLNARGEVIASAVANLDIHDIARTCRTYGAERFFVATPLEDQQRLVEEILRHWVEGPGGRRNPHRKEALERVAVVGSVEEAVAAAQGRAGGRLRLYATSARAGERPMGWMEAADELRHGVDIMLLFGTASGLAPGLIARCDGLLPPIRPASDYRHLPVRAAVAIVLDRLLGDITVCTCRNP